MEEKNEPKQVSEENTIITDVKTKNKKSCFQILKNGFKKYRLIVLSILLIIISSFSVWAVYKTISNKSSNKDTAIKDTPEKRLARIKANLGPKPTLVLPFSLSGDIPSTLMPMGETIAHPDTPDGSGHPGIDFQWNYTNEVRVTASMDAKITHIIKNQLGNYDVLTENQNWGVDYDGMREYNPELKEQQYIKVGDYIGKPFYEINNGIQNTAFHWQFGYANYLDSGKSGITGVSPRLCPMNYFSPESKIVIEQIWAKTSWPELRANAPEICSNIYKYQNE